jgi:hypothetical protein
MYNEISGFVSSACGVLYLKWGQRVRHCCVSGKREREDGRDAFYLGCRIYDL